MGVCARRGGGRKGKDGSCQLWENLLLSVASADLSFSTFDLELSGLNLRSLGSAVRTLLSVLRPPSSREIHRPDLTTPAESGPPSCGSAHWNPITFGDKINNTVGVSY